MSQLEDRLRIREVIERFHDAVNQRDFASIGALFAADGVWEVAAPFDRRLEGPGIAAGVAENVGRLEFLVQTCSPIVIELLDAANATARTSMQEWGRFKDGTSMRVAGTYFDTLRKDGGAWRFVHRVFHARYADDAVLTGQIFPGKKPA